ncbi:hypothetical protein NFI96_015430, partial [Prochilodus magdalenae]
PLPVQLVVYSSCKTVTPADMALLVAEIATSFLIFVCVVQGIRSLQIEYKQSLNATVGQNVSLPCIVSEEDVYITQLEWHKVGKTGDEKLVVFNPMFSPPSENVTLQLVNKPGTNKLQGTILLLNKVTEENNGDYICEISTYPHGSFRRTSKMTVTVPWITAQVESPGTPLVEGDEVKITCASHPPADRYRLHSLQTRLLLESQTGHFTVQNVTRHCTDLICRPLWTSSNQHLRSLNASVQLTVDYLDPIECDANSSIEVETGTDLNITCTAKSSRRLYYTWIKEKVTVSSHATMSLWSVNPDRSGVYSLTISAKHLSRLQRQREFLVTVVNRRHVGTTTIPKETTSQVTEGTTLATAKRGLSTVTSRPVCIYNTTTPSAGNITTSHANITAAHPPENISTPSSLNASAEGTTGCCRNGTSRPGSTGEGSTHPNSTTFLKPRTTISRPGATMFKPRTTISKPGTTMFKPNWTKNFVATVKTVQDQSSSKSHAAYILIPVILLLVLIGFLYRRYLIQKRMDMPPPFKPPPPPVKYTSVRSQDIPVTDILV